MTDRRSVSHRLIQVIGAVCLTALPLAPATAASAGKVRLVSTIAGAAQKPTAARHAPAAISKATALRALRAAVRNPSTDISSATALRALRAAVHDAPSVPDSSDAQALAYMSEGDGAPRASGPNARATFRVASTAPGRLGTGGLTILQFGDSHTAADFFTGEVRRLLQERYGDGGPGYINAGKPRAGVRSAAVNMTTSPGWTYSALQKSEAGADFYLSGFTAQATHSGETITASARQSMPYDLIEIEVSTGPKAGAIRVGLDTLEPFEKSLETSSPDHIVYRFMPADDSTSGLRQLSITTTDDRPVKISSIGIFNRHYGVSYSNIGFPGATVELLNKFDTQLFSDELKRLQPQIVVIAFGTNEGFDDNLDIDRYRARYQEVIRRVRANLPNAAIVMVGPAQGGRKAAAGGSCEYPNPPKLARVRAAQKDIADREGAAFWDWWGIMPAQCGAHAWRSMEKPLMAADHIHFTPEGYRVSAQRFAEFLFPIVDRFRSGPTVALSKR